MSIPSNAYGPKTAARRRRAAKTHHCLEAGMTSRCRDVITPGELYDEVTIFPGHQHLASADGKTWRCAFCMPCAAYFGKP